MLLRFIINIETIDWAVHTIDSVQNSAKVGFHIKEALTNSVQFHPSTGLNTVLPWLKTAYAIFAAEKLNIETLEKIYFYEVTVQFNAWEYFSFEIEKLKRTVCLPYWTMCDADWMGKTNGREKEFAKDLGIIAERTDHRHMIFMTAEKDKFVRILFGVQQRTRTSTQGRRYGPNESTLLFLPIPSMIKLLFLISNFSSEEADCVNAAGMYMCNMGNPLYSHDSHYCTNMTLFHHSLFHMCLLFPGCLSTYMKDSYMNVYNLERCVNPLSEGTVFSGSAVELRILNKRKFDKGFVFHHDDDYILPVVSGNARTLGSVYRNVNNICF